MTTTTYVAHGTAPDEFIERRRALGHDGRDEVWEGVYHVVPHSSAAHGRLVMRLALGFQSRAADGGLEVLPEFNLGVDSDFRVPDMAWVVTGAELGLYVPTAEIVVEVVSPGDASRDKLPFYLARRVREVWLVDPADRTIVVHAPHPATTSAVLEVSLADIAEVLGWS